MRRNKSTAAANYGQYPFITSLIPPPIAGRNSDGTWIPENPSSTDNYVEGNAEQFSWMMRFDPTGMFAQLCGNTAAGLLLTQVICGENDAAGLHTGNVPSAE